MPQVFALGVEYDCCMRSLPGLREYLDEIGFANLYRYIVSVAVYPRTPLAITAWSQSAVLAVDTYLDAPLDGRRLAWTLMANAPVAQAELNANERIVADALLHDGLLLEHDGRLRSRFQLICVEQLYLFVDSRVNFPGSGEHEVYIGDDTLSLLYYLGGVPSLAGKRTLDLGTGTGVIGLVAAQRGAQVTMIDIAGPAIEIAQLNRTLNRLEDKVSIRQQDFDETLASGTWNLITCNPPFIAAPPEFAVPVFARGDDQDGLGHLRRVLARLPAVLDEPGEALFVADFLGDYARPFVIRDLAPLAREFNVEVYVDTVRPVGGHIDAMANLVTRAEPHRALAATRRRLDDFLRQDLGAANIYLAVVRIRRGSPGLAIYNRWLKLGAASSPRAASSGA